MLPWKGVVYARQLHQRLARDLARLPGVDLTFEVPDLLDQLPSRIVAKASDVTGCVFFARANIEAIERSWDGRPG